jgi:outer membrane receptor protein involved in Fe transport
MAAKLLWRWLGLAGLLLALAIPAGAAPLEDPGEIVDSRPGSVTLEPITIMAPQPGVEISTEKTVIHIDQFRRAGLLRSLEDVLQEIGGIDVLRSNPMLASPGDEIAIRGLSEGRMVVEIDGRRINHTGHFGRFIVDWSTLTIDDIERVEIIRGAHTVLHPFAIGGVINIITKKGKKTKELKPEVSLSTGYASFNTNFVQGSVDGGLWDLVGYHFSASRQSTDGFLRNNFQWNNNFAGGLQFFLPFDATLWLGARYSHVNYGFPVVNDPAFPQFGFDPKYPPFRATADMLRHLPTAMQLPGFPIPQWNKDTYYLDAILLAPVGPGTVRVHLFTTNGRRDIHYYTRVLPPPAVFSNTQTRDVTRGLILEYKDVKLVERENLKNYLTVGFDYQLLGEPPSNNIIYNVKSLYLQDVLKWGRFTFTNGVRYYTIDMDTYYAWFEQGKPAPAFPSDGKQQRESDFFPSFKIDWQATQNTALYAAVSRALRLPCPETTTGGRGARPEKIRS